MPMKTGRRHDPDSQLSYANNVRGQSAERAVIRKYERQGWRVQRVGNAHGCDFKATKQGSTRYVEVKSGEGSWMRPKQKATQRRHGSKYKVHKVKRRNGKWDLSGIL